MTKLMFYVVDSFGEVIKGTRVKLGMTQKELAEKCGVGAIYISRIENNALIIPSDKVCVRLAEVLGLDPKELFLLARRLKTNPEFRKFLNNNVYDKPLTEDINDPIRKVLSDPSVKTLFIELTSAGLSIETMSRLLKSWVKTFIETLETLREETQKKKEH